MATKNRPMRFHGNFSALWPFLRGLLEVLIRPDGHCIAMRPPYIDSYAHISLKGIQIRKKNPTSELHSHVHGPE